jgi:membrane-associated phospholipid phosphatase
MFRYVLMAFLLSGHAGLAQTLADSLAARALITHWPDHKHQYHPAKDHFLLHQPILLRQLPPAPLAGTNPAKRVVSTLAAPALLLGFGFLTLDNPEYLESNEAVQKQILGHYAGFHSTLDNYTRYVPVAAVYGLNLAGVKGKSDLVSLTMIFALSNFINNSITSHLKVITRERRPDYPSFDAFPSGHTSTAFANAEVMHQEYKHLSAWYSVAGYSFAVATGTMRMVNNRHWLSDVMAGAGVGLLSTRLAYVIYPWLGQNINLHPFTKNKLAVVPVFQGSSYGISIGLPLGTPGAGRREK